MEDISKFVTSSYFNKYDDISRLISLLTNQYTGKQRYTIVDRLWHLHEKKLKINKIIFNTLKAP